MVDYEVRSRYGCASNRIAPATVCAARGHGTGAVTPMQPNRIAGWTPPPPDVNERINAGAATIIIRRGWLGRRSYLIVESLNDRVLATVPLSRRAAAQLTDALRPLLAAPDAAAITERQLALFRGAYSARVRWILWTGEAA